MSAMGSGGSSVLLEKNLGALVKRSPQAAAAIRAATPRPDVTFVETADGVPGVVLGGEGGGRTLASVRAPLAEGVRLAETLTLAEAGCAVVSGFGAGYHCRALVERMRRDGVLLCFEPDVGLLRAVFERVDHSAWLSEGLVVLVTEAENAAGLVSGVKGLEPLVMLGAKLMEHPASRARLGGASAVFMATVKATMKTMRASLATALVHSRSTLRNLFMNVDHYALSAGLTDLEGRCKGLAGIVVSAGPGLARAIETLRRAEVRERFVVIGATTVLKPLLRAGIRPDFICALDHHDLSRRFVEGLTAAEVEGITLVVEPKVNASVPALFPGPVRCAADQRLDDVLGPGLARKMGAIPAGSTVAHLSYYLARHLGCDPVILVGQDLGFTDGQYYAAGAAIHEVWGSELSRFNTLEMMEWQRLVRQGRHLLRVKDQLGREMFTDEQMAAYLQQFEAAFWEDAQRGLRVIDASEGGTLKRHTEVMPIAEAVERFAGLGGVKSLPKPAVAPDPEGRLAAVAARLTAVLSDARRIARGSREAAKLLRRAQAAGGDDAVFNAMVERVHRIRDEVEPLEPAYGLVQYVCQTGQMKRLKADRDLRIDPGLSEAEVRARRLERDIVNVEWLAEAADEVIALLDRSVDVIRGEKDRLTRDEDAAAVLDEVAGASGGVSGGALAGDSEPGPRRTRVGAVVMVDAEVGGLGQPRDLAAPLHAGKTALALTVERLLAAAGLDAVVVVCGEPERAASMLGAMARDPRVVVRRGDGARIRARAQRVGVARQWSRACWRGGLGGLTCYDEALDPRELAEAMRGEGLDAAVVVGADWALVDPFLIGDLVSRYRGGGGHVEIAFSQAPPGLGGFLIAGKAAASLAEAVTSAGAFASIGGVLGYVPTAPQNDPIAKDFCRRVPVEVRDCGERVVADTNAMRVRMAHALEDLGAGWLRADSAAVVAVLEPARASHGAWDVTMELCGCRLGGGVWSQRLARAWAVGGDVELERPAMSLDLARRVLERVCDGRDSVALTLHGAGDPLLHPEVRRIIAMARDAGVQGVHLRTDLLGWREGEAALVDLGADVISVDVLAAKAPTHRLLTGTDRYEAVVESVEKLVGLSGANAGGVGLGLPVIVPRITRCDEVYGEIEDFYNGWLMVASAAVIDPSPAVVSGARIQPLPLPEHAKRRRERESLAVRSDGTVVGLPPEEALIWAAPTGVWRGRVARVMAQRRTPTAA